MNAISTEVRDALEFQEPDQPAVNDPPDTAAAAELVEVAMLACGGTAGCLCVEDGGTVRPLSIAGDAARVDAVTRVRSSALPGERLPGVTIWRDVSANGADSARYHAIARCAGGAGEASGAILVTDGTRDPSEALRRQLELIARQAVPALRRAVRPAASQPGAPASPPMEARIAAARAEEGRRVTAELHALLGHELSSASLALSAATAGLDGEPACLDAVRAVADLLQGAVGRCRERMAAGYGIDAAAEGFAATLRRLSAAVARRGGVKVHVHVASGVSEKLTASSAYHLHHMAIDAIVGAVRYSQGSLVVVSVAADSDAILLQVDDDGTSAAGPALHEKRRVESIETVAHMLGGEVRLRARQPRGLSVRVRLPRVPGAALPRREARRTEMRACGRAESA